MDIEKEIKDIIAAVIVSNPFLGLLLKRTWIFTSDDVPTAATNGLTIIVNEKFFSSLSNTEKAFVLLHELMHIILKHTIRSKELEKRYGKAVVNVAADAKANQYLREYLCEYRHKLKIQPVWPEELPLDDVDRMSLEEVAEKLAHIASFMRTDVFIKRFCDSVLNNDIYAGAGVKKILKTLNKGDEGDDNVSDDSEIEKRVDRKVMEVVDAGVTPAGMKRLVDEILQSRISWRQLLRTALITAGKNVKRTWCRLNKKLPYVWPGKTLYATDIVVLIDTSASISDDELKQFIAEIHSMRKLGKVIVVPWDADVYEPVTITTTSTLLKGGGGTKLKPALELVDRKFRNSAVIIILSDWAISDIDDDDVKALLLKYRNKIIAVTSSREPPSFLKRIKIT